MNKVYGLVAISLIGFALMGCGSGVDTNNEANTDQTDGTSDMMGGDYNRPNPSLGTANGENIDDVDVKTNPNMQHTEEQMTGAEAIKDQRPEPQ